MCSLYRKNSLYTKFQQIWRTFWKLFFYQGVEKSNFQKALQAEILYSGGFLDMENTNLKNFDFDRWKLPLGGVYP